MTSLSASKGNLQVVFCLLVVVSVIVVDLVAASEGTIYRPEFESQDGQVTYRDSGSSTFQEPTLSRDDIKRELMRQLLLIQEAEESILNKVRQLEAERRAASNRKRSHYNSMCMFNVVACYRK